MATFNKFDSFKQSLGTETHNFSSDTLKIALTAHLPVSTDTVWSEANFPSPAAANGYPANGGTLLSVTWAAGVLDAADYTFTATSGGIGPFQYVVIYNDTAANDELVGWYAHTGSVTLADTETFTVTFSGGSILTIA